MPLSPIHPDKIPADHDSRMEATRLSLDGLAIGDGFGEMFFSRPQAARKQFHSGDLPPGPWWRTDDTEMAIGIVEVLRRRGGIDQDQLAVRFAERFAQDPLKGYGSGAARILKAIHSGANWRL